MFLTSDIYLTSVFNYVYLSFIRAVACDRVGHDIVLNFLEHYGLLGKNLSLFMLVNLNI